MTYTFTVSKLALVGLLGGVLVGCASSAPEYSPYGHQGDGIYILPPHEQAFTCAEFDGATRFSVRQAFANVNEGNRQAVMTLVSNSITLGMGGIPRGIGLGFGERALGRQELTKALALDSAARSNGCEGVDIPALVDAELGEGSLDKLVAERREGSLDPVLAEEAAIKGRLQ